MILLSLIAIVTQWTYTYTGGIQSQSFYQGCTYEVELWGANGGKGCNDGNCAFTGGTGAYIKGRVTLSTTTGMSIVVGGKGNDAVASNPQGGSGGYNGGGSSGKDTGTWPFGNEDPSGGGGGATDLRFQNSGDRIMAAGAGSGGVCGYNGAHGGAESEHGFVLQSNQVAYSSEGGTESSSGGNGVDARQCPGSGGGGGWKGGYSYDYSTTDYYNGVGRSGSSGYNSNYVTKLDVQRGDQAIARNKPNENGYAIVKLTNWQASACKCPKPSPSRSISPSRSVSPSPSGSASPSRSISVSRSPIPSEKIGRKGKMGFNFSKIFKASIQCFMLISARPIM